MRKEDREEYDFELMGGVLKGCLAAIAFWLALIVLVLLFAGCRSVKYVSVPEIHTIESHHTDSVHEVDSIILERETTIMMLDSAAMAEYGIKLANAERAWLVKTRELERELQRISKLKADTVHEVDSIPYPVPVEVEKEVIKPLNGWQKLRLNTGTIALVLLGGFVCWKLWKLWRYFHP